MKTIQRTTVATLSFYFVSLVLALLVVVCGSRLAFAQDKSENKLDETFLKNLQFRSIGPANIYLPVLGSASVRRAVELAGLRPGQSVHRCA